MATIGSIVIGMKVDTRMLTKGLNAASKHVDSFVSGLAGGLTALAGAAIFSKVTEGIVQVAEASSDLNEQISKSQQVFGDASAKVEADAKAMGDAFGYPKSQFIDGASSIGLIAKASGLSQQAAADMGSSFSKLAADVSSFYNTDVGSALDAIRSGLVGEAEPMRKFGVLLSEAAVQAEAMRLGLSKTGKELTEGQKVQARASLITKGLADAQGDLARTAEGAANKTRTIWGRLTNLGADIGTAFQPAIDAVLGFADGALVKLASGFQSVTGFIGQYLTSVGGLISSFGDLGSQILDYFNPAIETSKTVIAGWAQSFLSAIDSVAFVIRNLPDILAIAAIQISEKFINMTEYLGAFWTNLVNFGSYLANNWSRLILDGLNIVATGFQGLINNLANLGSAVVAFLQDPTQGFQFNWQPVFEGLELTADKLPDLVGPQLTSLQDMVDERLEAIGKRESARVLAATNAAAKLAEAKSPAAALAEDAAVAPGKQKDEIKFGAAMELGSSEAISAINQFRAGQSGDGSMKEVAKETKAQTRVLESIDRKLPAAARTAEPTTVMVF